jgi:Na+-transporting methylmalonyl-CoA/oxaloacetate decarboxylase gamma subunit
MGVTLLLLLLGYLTFAMEGGGEVAGELAPEEINGLCS